MPLIQFVDETDPWGNPISWHWAEVDEEEQQNDDHEEQQNEPVYTLPLPAAMPPSPQEAPSASLPVLWTPPPIENSAPVEIDRPDAQGYPLFNVRDDAGNVVEFSVVRDGVFGILPNYVYIAPQPVPIVPVVIEKPKSNDSPPWNPREKTHVDQPLPTEIPAQYPAPSPGQSAQNIDSANSPAQTATMRNPANGATITVIDGWILSGYDSAGNPLFHVTDDAHNVVEFSVIEDGVFGISPRYVAPAQANPAPAPVPISSAPRISPFFDPVPRQVGTDDHGNPVWRQVDEAGNVIQYRTIGGQPDYATLTNEGPFLSARAYVSPVVATPAPSTPAQVTYPAPVPPPPANNPPPPPQSPSPATPSNYPVALANGAAFNALGQWTYVGRDYANNPVFQLRDEAGTIVQWSIDTTGNILGMAAARTSLGTIDTSILARPQNVTPAPTPRPSVPAQQTPVQVQTVNPPQSSASTTYPIALANGANFNALGQWTYVGRDSTNNPVFQLRDESGSIIQWGIDTGGNYFGVMQATTPLGTMDTANLPRTNSATPPPTSANDNGGGSGQNMLLLAAAAIGVVVLTSRGEK